MITKGRLDVLKTLVRGHHIHGDLIESENNSSLGKTLGFFTDDFRRFNSRTVMACLREGWVERVEVQPSGACRLRLTPKGEEALRGVESRAYKIYNR
jgi:hypothetical protein